MATDENAPAMSNKNPLFLEQEKNMKKFAALTAAATAGKNDSNHNILVKDENDINLNNRKNSNSNDNAAALQVLGDVVAAAKRNQNLAVAALNAASKPASSSSSLVNSVPMATAAAAAVAISTTTGVKKRKAGRRWTAQEDSVLQQLVEKHGNRHWKKIAQEFFEISKSQRSDVQCLHRWNKCLKPGLTKGPWTDDEDKYIKETIEANGGAQNVRWSVIAKGLKGRLGKQVRERWINHLDPTIIKTEWTPAEDDTLYELQQRLGNKWKWIAELIPGRSENSVKNRWHSIKSAIIARKQGTGSSVSNDVSAATKSAAAAAVAAAVQATKNKKKRSNKRKASSPSSTSTSADGEMSSKKRRKSKSKSKKKKNGSSPSSVGRASLSDLLSIGQSLDVSGPPISDPCESPLDTAIVAEKANELLRMSESYREMAKVMLKGKDTKSSAPQFNDHLQEEIARQIAKLPQLQQQQKQQPLPLPPQVLTSFPNSDKDTTSPLSSTDPVLFSNFFNVFSKLSRTPSSSSSSAVPSSLPLTSQSLNASLTAANKQKEIPMSPQQLLLAAAAAAAASAPSSSSQN